MGGREKREEKWKQAGEGKEGISDKGRRERRAGECVEEKEMKTGYETRI